MLISFDTVWKIRCKHGFLKPVIVPHSVERFSEREQSVFVKG